MSFTLQANKNTTLANDLLSGATTGTLSSAAFSNFTGDYLVVDYDNPSKLEIILCTVSSTSITSITRGQSGTSDVDHSAGAKIGYMFVPGHFTQLGTIAASDTFLTTWTPAFGGFSVDPVIVTKRYFQFGKFVFWMIDMGEGTSNATTFTITLPVAAKSAHSITSVAVRDNGAAAVSMGMIQTRAGSTTADVYPNNSVGNWTGSGGKSFSGSGWYEAN